MAVVTVLRRMVLNAFGATSLSIDRERLIRWASYALVLALPVSNFWPLGHEAAANLPPVYVTPGLHASDLPVALVLLAGICAARGGVRWSTLEFSFPLLALVILGVLTIPYAHSSSLAAYFVFRWGLATAVYFVLARHEVPFGRLAAALILTLGFQAIIGIGQFLTKGPLGLPGELALGLDQTGTATVAAGGTRWLRAYGLMFNPNVLGGFLALGIICSLPLLNRLRWRSVWWLLWVGLLLSFSRSAWLATGLCLPLAVGILAKRYPSYRRVLFSSFLGLAFLGLLSSIIVGGQVATRLRPLDTVSERVNIIGRIEMWKVALGIIRARPIRGVGAGNFPLAVAFSDSSFLPDHAHNVALQLAAEIGVLGAGAWLSISFSAGLELLRLRRSSNQWTAPLLCAVLALGVIALFDGYPWILNEGRLITVIILALATQALRRQ